MGAKGWMGREEGVGWCVKCIEDSFPLVWAMVMMVALLLPNGHTPYENHDMIHHEGKVP
jgi:hypothetical protein